MNKNQKIIVGVLAGATLVGITYLIYKRIKKGGKVDVSSIKEVIPNFNKYSSFSTDSLKNARALEKDAYGNYKWSGGSGMPIDIYFKGEKPLFTKPNDGSTYCTGYTFATMFVTALNRGLLNDFSDDDIKKLHNVWNIGDAKTFPKLCVDAISKPINKNVPLGKEVSLEDAVEGDFCQIWRKSGSGHSVVLIEKINKNGKVVALRYYSSNAGRNQTTGRTGAGEGTEYYSDSGGGMLRDKTYFARLKQ